MSEKYEYAIIPVCFRDYNEYVDCLNEMGQQGWETVHMICIYPNSPSQGWESQDWVCKRKIVTRKKK